MKYDGKDSVEISCDEFLEVPINIRKARPTLGRAFFMEWYGTFRGNLSLIFVFAVLLPPFQDRVIDEESHTADYRCDDDEEDGLGVVLGAYGVPAEGGEDDRGEACRRGQGDIEGDAHVGQTDGVG